MPIERITADDLQDMEHQEGRLCCRAAAARRRSGWMASMTC